jgi:hypothetical protein
MPIVHITYGSRLTPDDLRQLAADLPHAVSVVVACPEEPYDHDLRPGDVEIRFGALGQYDVSGMDLVVEVRSKYFESRAHDRQQRCTSLRDTIADLIAVENIAVYLTLPVAAWSQTE